MAIKIGKWYITRNNPREILRICANKQNIIDELKEYMVNLYIVGYTIQNATLDSIFHKIKELEEKYDER